MTLKIGISRSNFISGWGEDFRVFSYVIWLTGYEKNIEKNHWGILNLGNLQSRSHFIFCTSESWRRLFSVIDALKKGKTVTKKSLRHLWPWICLFRGEILVSSTNAVSFNLISEGYIKYCGIHSQHDLRSTTWTRNFCFAISVWEYVHLCCWCTEYETNIITYRRNSSHLQKYLNVKKLIYC